MALESRFHLRRHIVLGVVHLEQRAAVCGRRDLPFPQRRHNHLCHSRQGTSLGRLVAIPEYPRQEARCGTQHREAHHTKSPWPGDVLRDVGDCCDSNDGANADREEEPVEVAADLLAFLWVVQLKLIGAEGRQAGPEHASTQSYDVEPHHEDGVTLCACERRATEVRLWAVGLQAWHCSRDHHQHNSLHSKSTQIQTKKSCNCSCQLQEKDKRKQQAEQDTDDGMR